MSTRSQVWLWATICFERLLLVENRHNRRHRPNGKKRAIETPGCLGPLARLSSCESFLGCHLSDSALLFAIATALRLKKTCVYQFLSSAFGALNRLKWLDCAANQWPGVKPPSFARTQTMLHVHAFDIWGISDSDFGLSEEKAVWRTEWKGSGWKTPHMVCTLSSSTPYVASSTASFTPDDWSMRSRPSTTSERKIYLQRAFKTVLWRGRDRLEDPAAVVTLERDSGMYDAQSLSFTIVLGKEKG